MWPSSNVEWLAAIVGLAFGCLYALSGFRDSGKNDSLSDNPRLKNLQWLLLAGAAAFIADWDKITADPGEDRVRVMLVYVESAATAALVVVGAVAIGIAFQARAWNRQQPSSRLDPWKLVIEYAHHGFGAYRRLLKEAEKAAADGAGKRVSRLHELAATNAGIIAAHIQAAQQYLGQPTLAGKGMIEKSLLDAMCNLVKAWAPDPTGLEINANYMLALPFGTTNAVQRASMRFTWGDQNRYGHLLVLAGQTGISAPYSLTLPVEANRDSDMLLPGAPEAFATRESCIVNVDSLGLRKGIPRETRTEIERYFAQQKFKSFLSIVVMREGAATGVVNIDSNKLDIVGKGTRLENHIARALQPYCTLLGLVVS